MSPSMTLATPTKSLATAVMGANEAVNANTIAGMIAHILRPAGRLDPLTHLSERQAFERNGPICM
ncbi:MAG: hypothetical protein JJ869_20560 [Marivita sp.]|uniref:hypothetical protein n=1 Tax=Marivita sp. TaxID=2003365 RepID=UPI001AFD4186|nr:hypothetical protein [Marivita sp.]MBO6885947.1 hypothetical protein [Marivita sp.]